MNNIRYGVEYITETQDKITVYKTKEKAEAEAKALAEGMKQGETVSLFYAECDAQGKLSTNEYHILNVWG